MTMVQFGITYLKVAKIVDLSTKKKWELCEMIQMLANVVMGIILQYVSISNQRAVYLKLPQCCMAIIPQ